MREESDTSLSRFLSLVLRHRPAAAFLTLDSHGWAEVDALLAGCRRAGKQIDRERLERIVREDEKGRYAFDADHRRIRARQGHSLAVDLELREETPPPVLYHGTASRFLDGIRAKGITPQSRQFVHLSANLDTARKVGSRHGKPVVLPIDTGAVIRSGERFYQAENGVWLCKTVPWSAILDDQIQWF